MPTPCYINLTGLVNKLSLFHDKTGKWQKISLLVVHASSERQAIAGIPSSYLRKGYSAAVFSDQDVHKAYKLDNPGHAAALRGRLLNLFDKGIIQVECLQPAKVDESEATAAPSDLRDQDYWISDIDGGFTVSIKHKKDPEHKVFGTLEIHSGPSAVSEGGEDPDRLEVVSKKLKCSSADIFVVMSSEIRSAEQGKGYGQAMYLIALQHLNKNHPSAWLTNDFFAKTSPAAERVWNKLSDHVKSYKKLSVTLPGNFVRPEEKVTLYAAKGVAKRISASTKDKTRVASVAVFDPEMRLLFGKRNDSGKWTLPGGHLESGESGIVGAFRELREETGIPPSSSLLYLGTGEAGRNNDLLVHCYVTTTKYPNASGANDPDNECAEWRWVETKDWKLPEDVLSNLHAPKNITLQKLGLQDITPVDVHAANDLSDIKFVKKDFYELVRGKMYNKLIKLTRPIPDGLRSWMKNVRSGDSDGFAEEAIAILAIKDGEPIGWCVVRFEHWHSTRDKPTVVYNVFVHPDYRRTGIGSKLIEKTKSLTRGMSKIAFPQDKAGIKLYEKFNIEGPV